MLTCSAFHPLTVNTECGRKRRNASWPECVSVVTDSEGDQLAARLYRLRREAGLSRKVARRVSQGLKPALILRPLCPEDPRLKPWATSPGLSQKPGFTDRESVV